MSRLLFALLLVLNVVALVLLVAGWQQCGECQIQDVRVLL